METLREGPPADPAPEQSTALVGAPRNTDMPQESTELTQTSQKTEADKQPISRDLPPSLPLSSFTSSEGHFRPRPARQTGGKNLQSVVTTSFSVEDVTLSPGRYHLSTERRDAGHTSSTLYPKVGGTTTVINHKQSPRPQPPSDVVVTAASPRNRAERPVNRTHSISRSYSSTTADSYSSLPMKRNFFHHAGQSQSYGGLPPDFVPPKRAKGPPRPRKKEILLEARLDRDLVEARSWYTNPPPPHVAPSQWESHCQHERAGYLEDTRSHMRSQSFPTPRWVEEKNSRNSLALHHAPRHIHPMEHVAEAASPYCGESRHRDWRSHTPYHPSYQHHQWGPPIQMAQARDDVEFSHHSRMDSREMRESFDDESRESPSGERSSNRDEIFRTPSSQPTTQDKMKLVVDAASFTEGKTHFGGYFLNQNSLHKAMLLAMPDDKVSLSETLCVVRENIEVFKATQTDVEAPAPGRKHAIVVGQVGLRCIHCRHTKKASERVKRAVCYPSSLKRIYRTVIDMKLDHFTQCKYVPLSLKQRLNDLKSVHTRSTGTTMQYFIKSAMAMGMEDGPSGVRLNKSFSPSLSLVDQVRYPPEEWGRHSSNTVVSQRQAYDKPRMMKTHSGENSVSSMDISKRSESMGSQGSFDPVDSTANRHVTGPFYYGMVPLSLPEDSSALSPLRCFLREQVCAFAATESDISIRAPTTFSIGVGQVGIGCIHCVKLSPGLRSNRAVCFPFSIGRIYQSVADIQRFHLGECQHLPHQVRERFLALQNASSKGSKGLATRQYWVESAKKLGMIDTTRGIRFGRDPAKPLASRSFSLDILAQAAISVTTTSRKLVLPEDKGTIAEFLYVVMEQLQPCRFTEADRNKRRLKDVGCIGVECKHCAGQVDSRKFFWSSVSAVESNFVSVHSHMFECRMVPDTLKARLSELKELRKEQTAQLMTGSQKAFFRRVWERLHDEEPPTNRPPNNQVSSLFSASSSEDEVMQKTEV